MLVNRLSDRPIQAEMRRVPRRKAGVRNRNGRRIMRAGRDGDFRMMFRKRIGITVLAERRRAYDSIQGLRARFHSNGDCETTSRGGYDTAVGSGSRGSGDRGITNR